MYVLPLAILDRPAMMQYSFYFDIRIVAANIQLLFGIRFILDPNLTCIVCWTWVMASLPAGAHAGDK